MELDNIGDSYGLTHEDMVCKNILFQTMEKGGFPQNLLPPSIVRDYEEPPEMGKGQYDIEGMLGLYIPREPEIRLYEQGIETCSKALQIETSVLRTVVLVHELAHWATHLFPYKDYRDEKRRWLSYCASGSDIRGTKAIGIHEGWAQLLTWWVVEEAAIASGKTVYRDAFLKLNEHQSDPYREYLEFKDKDRDLLFKSLLELRMYDTDELELRHWHVWFSCEGWSKYLRNLSEADLYDFAALARIETAGMPLIECNPENIEHMRVTTDKMQIRALTLSSGKALCKIRGNLSSKVQEALLRINPVYVKDIPNLDPELRERYQALLNMLQRFGKYGLPSCGPE